MADKKMNETLAEQRRVHKELLELKRANKGEIVLENKTPLEAAMPKTLGGKIKNYMYHYKVAIIVGLLVAALATFLVIDTVTKVKPDIEIVAHTHNRILDEQLDCIVEIIEPYCTDINKDDEVKLSPINCTFQKGSTATELEYTSSMHFNTLISGDPQAILFLLDEDTWQHLLEVNDGKSFMEGEPLRLNQEIYDAVKKKTGYDLPDGLMICYRTIKGSTIEKDDISEDCYKSAKVVIAKMKEKYPADTVEEKEGK